MKAPDKCPTCGTTLGPLHADALLRCGACQKVNPRGFRYCGFCAAPMETEAIQAEKADVAAPAGGWPNLSRELVELRFYMERGELDEAYELLTILRERHPGHPALAEFRRAPAGKNPRPDTQVNRVVDSVLAGSQSLSSAMPRRSVPEWKAPAAAPPPPASRRKSETPPAVRKRIVRADDKAGSFRAVGTPSKIAHAVTNKHLGAVPIEAPGHPSVASTSGKTSDDEGADAITKPEPAAPPLTEADQAPQVELPPIDTAGSRSGMTIAVPTLQAPAPFRDEQGDVPRRNRAKAVQSVARKRQLKSQKRTGKQAIVEQQIAQGDPEPRHRPRGTSFGQHVLGRLGTKNKRGRGKG